MQGLITQYKRSHLKKVRALVLKTIRPCVWTLYKVGDANQQYMHDYLPVCEWIKEPPGRYYSYHTVIIVITV